MLGGDLGDRCGVVPRGTTLKWGRDTGAHLEFSDTSLFNTGPQCTIVCRSGVVKPGGVGVDGVGTAGGRATVRVLVRILILAVGCRSFVSRHVVTAWLSFIGGVLSGFRGVLLVGGGDSCFVFRFLERGTATPPGE